MFGLGITKYVLIVCGVIIAGLSLAAYILLNKVEELNQDIATLKTNVTVIENVNKELNSTIETMEKQRKEDQAEIALLGSSINTITKERDNAVAKYNGYRDRIGKLGTKKPGLVGKLATRATDRVMQQFSCASGNTDEGDCAGKVPPATTGANSKDAN